MLAAVLAVEAMSAAIDGGALGERVKGMCRMLPGDCNVGGEMAAAHKVEREKR